MRIESIVLIHVDAHLDVSHTSGDTLEGITEELRN